MHGLTAHRESRSRRRGARLAAVLAGTLLLAVALGAIGAVADSVEAARLDAAAVAVAGPEAPPGAADHSDGASRAPRAPTPGLERRYVVELTDPPLARYTGGIGKLPATAAWSLGEARLDVTSAAARAYVKHLKSRQALARARVRLIAPAARFDWSYLYVLNGFAATLTPEQAARVAKEPGVRAVQVEESYEPEMDGSLELTGAFDAFDEVGGIDEAGLGARIAVIDSGTDSQHPFFSDEGMPPAPSGWPTATMHLRDGTVLAYPNPEAYTNNKVIGARVFVSPEAIGDTDPYTALLQMTPLGTGHGLHVSGTAAGRDGTYTLAPNGQDIALRLSGVAPMAQVLNYKSNYAASPEYVAMLDQMVVDRVDVLNMSQGHVTWLIDRPETHPISRAFDGAADAGIVVVMSAGNAGGNGLTSLSGAFKYSEKVLAVGNATSLGSFDVLLVATGSGLTVPEIPAAPRGVFTPDGPIVGPFVLAPAGGCVAAPEVAGAIAVVDRWGEGNCGYEARASLVASSGAIAIIYYYDDRPYGVASSSGLALPAVAIGTRGGDELMAWLRAGGSDGQATISDVIQRGRSEVPDVVSDSSSRGPGLDWTLKPDITAPGESIVSSYYVNDGGRYVPGFAALSGTSMASPHVAGAAALLRAAHPTWTSAAVRSALVNTAARTLTTSSEDDAPLAAPYEGGPGRLDLRHALDPGAVLDPPKASFGKLAVGDSGRLEIAVRSVSDAAEQWSLSVYPITGTSATVAPAGFTLEPGESVTVTVSLDAIGGGQPEHWGEVLLSRDPSGAGAPLRLTYYAYVEDPAVRKDVLLVNWLYGDTSDYAVYYTATLQSLGLTYDVWTIDDPSGDPAALGHVPFRVLQRYDLIVLNQNESAWAFQESLPGAYQYQNVLLHGGNMLIAGQGQMNWWRFLGKGYYPDNPTYRQYCGEWWPHCFVGPSQNAGCDMCLPRYFAGFTYGVTATLSGKVLGAHELPVTPTLPLVLPPHGDADGPFSYSVDLSTGDLAKDGAAGNQYTFASGGILGPYVPSGVTAVEERDYDSTEGVFDRLRPYAKPLWSYTGGFVNDEGETEVMTKVVGTYIAGGQEPEAEIAWNAMFWGFGLEGVGKGDAGTVGRDRVLGDAFNFLARNLRADAVTLGWEPLQARGLTLRFPDVAEPPMVSRAVVVWEPGGEPEVIAFDPPVRADQLTMWHEYDADGPRSVTVTLYPSAHAAPLYDIRGEVEASAAVFPVFLPATVRSSELSGGGALPPGLP